MHSAAPALRLYRGDGRAALGVVALCALLAGLTFLDVYGSNLMKRFARLAAIALLALPLIACNGMTRMLDTMPKEDRALVLKGASEHIQKCDRKYWAKTGLPGSAGFEIDCKPSVEAQAEILARAVTDAIAKLGAAAAATPAPVSPK